MKTAWKLCLALALMVAALLVVKVPAFAAGTHTVSGTVSQPEGVTGLEVDDLTFKLYRVGDFGRDLDPDSDNYGNATLVLDSRLGVDSSGLVIKKSDYTDEKEWVEAWAAQARTIALYLDRIDGPVGVTTSSAGGKFAFPGIENGLYLLVNSDEPQFIKNVTDGKYYSWLPQPMLVMVLNDDVELGIKWDEEDIVNNYAVNKQWKPTDGTVTHPDSVKVDIYFNYVEGDEEGNANKLVDTVTLKADSDPAWTYTWTLDTYKDKVKEKGGDPFTCTYTVVEKQTGSIVRNYEVINETTTSADQQTTIITNTYDVRKLKLKKIMKSYVNNGSKATTTFVFEIEGTDADNNQVYLERVGLQIDPEEVEKEIEILDVPRTVEKIRVKEIYAGGYTPDPADWQDAIQDPDDEKSYSVTFINDKGTPYYSGGVINKFRFDADKEPNYTWEALGSVFSSED